MSSERQIEPRRDGARSVRDLIAGCLPAAGCTIDTFCGDFGICREFGSIARQKLHIFAAVNDGPPVAVSQRFAVMLKRHERGEALTVTREAQLAGNIQSSRSRIWCSQARRTKVSLS
jgi:hypothetical protein